MSSKDQLFAALDRAPVVGILRGCPTEHVVAIGTAAFAAGVGVLEVTLDSPTPTESIARLVEALPEVVVGAGTVRRIGDVEMAAAADAAFIVTPMLSLGVMAAAAAQNLACIPGASTPTEIWTALEVGADAVKVFPARQLGGPAYIAAIAGPLGAPPLIPTGGVDADHAAAYLVAGARALGVGGSVFPRGALASGDSGQVGSLAAELIRSLE